MKPIQLNPGAQSDFVLNEYRHSAYMGGRGAGKTLASVIRGLIFSSQPKIPGQRPPTGCLLAVSMPQLKANVYPAMYLAFELADMKEGKDWKEIKDQSDRKFVLLENGAEILMRSLDEPNKVRGMNLAWFGIDEGRLFDTDEPYKILLACLRQGRHKDKEVDLAGGYVPGESYRRGGWVTSTPNGYDWMWRRFHPKSPKLKENTIWYNAPTYENEDHLPHEFIRDLEIDYEVGSLHFRQEVLGEFVGAVKGAVWPMFDPEYHVTDLYYNPKEKLLAGWDFGYGDSSVCLFAQIEYVTRELHDGSSVEQPQLRVIGSLEATRKTVKEFANMFYEYCDKHFAGRVPSVMFGDPAGLQVQQVTGTSTIRAFAEHGIHIRPAPKRPLDEGIIIVANIMERVGGFFIDEKLDEVQKAVQTYRWKIDDQGYKLSREPIHDWTSHTCSALRYLALGSIGLRSRRHPAAVETYERGTMGYLMDRLLEEPELVMNPEETRSFEDWHPDEQIGLEGLV